MTCFAELPLGVGRLINAGLLVREQMANQQVCKAAGQVPPDIQDALFKRMAQDEYLANSLADRTEYRGDVVIRRSKRKLDPTVKSYLHDSATPDEAILDAISKKRAHLDQLCLEDGDLERPVGPCVAGLVAASAHIRVLSLKSGLAEQFVPLNAVARTAETVAGRSLLELLKAHPGTVDSIKFTGTHAFEASEIHPKLKAVGFTELRSTKLGRFFMHTLSKGA